MKHEELHTLIINFVITPAVSVNTIRNTTQSISEVAVWFSEAAQYTVD